MSTSFLLDEHEQLEALLAGLQERAPLGWRPHRILFRNFWLFRREEFVWHHGRLFLGGQNRAGKSTVLSMALPVLLDGNKSDERLQTFGGRGRHMAYYMTGARPGEGGEDQTYQHAARTSYMALEFYRETPHSGAGEYRTFGQGLRHDREAADKSVKSWGFVINDGRRLGRTAGGVPFDVLKGPVCLEKGELKRLLGDGGQVFDSNLEYRKAVNRELFGFKDLGEFEALIDLLLEIRSPGLANNCRPSRVAAILSESLPAISESVTQNTADALDNIDRTTDQIESTGRHIDAVRVLDKATAQVYRRGAEIAAARFLRARDEAGEAARGLAAARAELEAARREKADAEQGLAGGAHREQELRAEDERLKSRDVYRAAADRTRLQAELDAKQERHRAAQGHAQRDDAAQQGRRDRLRAKERRWESEREGVIEATRRLADAGRSARWQAPDDWASGLSSLWPGLRLQSCPADLALQVPRSIAEQEAGARLQRIRALGEAVERRDQAAEALRSARAAEDAAQRRFFEAEARWTQAQTRVREAKEAAAAAIADWSRGLEALHPPAETIGTVAAAVLAFDHGGAGRVHDLLEPIRDIADRTQQAARDEIAALRAAVAAQEETLARLRAARRALDAAPPEPVRTPEQQRAREVLAAAGLRCAPLYETLEFAAGLEPASAAWTEEALGQMGLLDALVVEAAQRVRAMELLRESGCGERVLLARGAAAHASLTAALAPDPEHPLAAEALRGLAPADEGDCAGLGAGVWRHGLLEGTASTPPAARFIGRSARERHRLAEIARIEAEMAALQRETQAKGAQIAEQERRIGRILSEWSRLDRAAALAEVETARRDLGGARGEFERERDRFEQATQQTEGARMALREREAALDEGYRSFPDARGLDRTGLADMTEATAAVRELVGDLHRRAESLQSGAADAREIAAEIGRAAQALQEKQEEIALLEREIGEARGQLLGIKQLLGTADAQQIFARVEEIRNERAAVARERDALNKALGAADRTVRRLEPEVPELENRAGNASGREEEARAALRTALEAYPTLADLAGRAADDAAQVAAGLLGRFGDHSDLVSHLEALYRSDSGELSKTFAEQRQVLEPTYRLEYRPADATRLVTCGLDGGTLAPCDLLVHLERQREDLRRVLEQHEVELFERHLLREAGQEVRRCMTRARDWVRDTCALLAGHPMNDGTTVALEWEAKRTDFEAGGVIAKRAHLLWKEEVALSAQERDLLREAFRDEIRQVREQARRDEWRSEAFRQQLAAVLDYRTWFRFRLFVCGGIAGRRRELTDQVWAAGSGSERAMHVLLPLFAGLVSRYGSGDPEAPRMLALDEAFAGLDAVNVRQLIRVLTAFGLTWVCTSDKVPRLTEDLPGASMYVMLRDGLETASRTFVWDGHGMVEMGA